jgi:uncharacterized membrane protein YciS (DUF1049 family)
MKFEISERIRRNKSQNELLGFIENQFKKIAENVSCSGQVVYVTSVEASFGSINRSDDSEIKLKKAEGGWLIVADVNYRPSIVFWIYFFIGLFSVAFWVIPLFFYINNKKTVKSAIAECLQRIKSEFEQSVNSQENTAIDDLQKLGELKEKGLINENEFEIKKKQLLGL